MTQTMNTYISVSIFVSTSGSSGRIYLSNKSANLDLHLDVPYEQAKQELARLMLRTGQMPEIVGKGNKHFRMYTLDAFLD